MSCTLGSQTLIYDLITVHTNVIRSYMSAWDPRDIVLLCSKLVCMTDNKVVCQQIRTGKMCFNICY